MWADDQAAARRTVLCNGDFVSLFVEDLKGVASVDILTTREVTVYQGDGDSANQGTRGRAGADGAATAPNFEQSCVFQMKAVTDLPEGATLKYGDVVRIVHRGSQRSLTRQNRGVGGKHAVALENTDRGSSHFRLLPRFKIRSIGEPIILNDQVIFQNEVVIEGNRTFLMAEQSEDSPKVLLECGAHKTTGIRVRLFATYDVSSKAFLHVLKGGDFVRLFHHEANGFLVVARHTGDDEPHDFLGREHTVCLRALGAGRNPDDYHDASSIWQVRLEDTERRGGRPVTWSDRIRLKNVLTNDYLDVCATTATGAMAPSRDKGTSTLFSLVESTRAATEDGGAGSTPSAALLPNQQDLRIPYHSFFYLRGDHAPGPNAAVPGATEQFVHVDAQHYTVEEDDENGDGGQSLTFAQTVLSATHDEDAFSLQSVQQQDIRDFYYALGHCKVLARLAEESVLSDVAAPSKADLYKQARRSIHALIQFCSEDKIEDSSHVVGRPHVLHQNILFDLQVHEPLMKVVAVPFEGARSSKWKEGWRERLTQPAYKPFNKLARDIYRLLSYLCRENVHVGLTLANSHLHAMINQCRLIGYLDNVSWDIADTLDEMFKDNSILLNRVTRDSIETYLSLVHEAHSPADLAQFLRLLASLCSVDGEAITSTQNAIRDLVLKPDSPSSDILPVSNNNNNSGGGDGGDGITQITARVHTAGKPFSAWRLVTVPLKEYLQDADNLEYYEATLELYAQLCLEGNCQRELQHPQRTPFVKIMAALRSDLPPHIKARFCSLLINLYVEGDDLPEVDHANRRWQDLGNDKAHSKLRHQATSLFDVQAVVAWVEAYLSREDVLSYKPEYHDAANSKRPEIAALKEEELHSNTLTQQVVHLAQAMVNKGLYWDPARRQRLVHLLLALLARTHPDDGADMAPTSSLDVVMEVKTNVCRALGACMDAHLDDVVTELLHAFKKEYLAHKHRHIEAHESDRALREVSIIRGGAQHHHFFETFGISEQQVVHLLLALSTYPSDALRVVSLNLLLRTFNVKGDLLTRLADVVVIADAKDEAALEKLEQLLLTLKHQDHADLHAVSRSMTQEIQWMCAQCITINGTLAAELLQEGGKGRLPWANPGAKLEPHHAHQEMMRNAHAHEAVLHILHHHLSGADLKEMLEDQGARDLFSACFEFLAFFCWHNKHNQELLGHARNISFFVHACSYGIHAEKVLHRMFEGEPDLVQEHVVEEGKVDRLIADLINEPRCRNVDFIKLLEVIVAPSGVPIKELQDKVGEHFLQAEEKSHLFERDLGDAHFVAFLVSTYAKAGDAEADDASTTTTMTTASSRALATGGQGHGPLTEREQELRAFYEELLSFYVITAHGNQATAAHVSKHVPLPELAQPFLDGVTLPTHLKTRLLALLRNVYLMHDTDEEEGEGDGAGAEDLDADDFGFVSGAMKQETCVQLCGPLAAELQAIDRGWKHKPRSVRAELDAYAFMTLLPLAADLLRVFVEEKGNMPPEELVSVATPLATACARFLKHRRQASFNSPNLLLDHEHRVLGGNVAQQLLHSDLLSQEEKLLVDLQAEHRWYDETDAKEARTAAARSTARSVASKHGSTKHHTFSIDSFAATHGRGGGRGKTRGGGKMPPRKVMPVEKVKTEGERIQEELPFFIDQVREAFNRGFSPPHLPWMSFLNTEYNFSSFWSLVGILQRDLLEDSKHEQEEEEEEEGKGPHHGGGARSHQHGGGRVNGGASAQGQAPSRQRSRWGRHRSRVHTEELELSSLLDYRSFDLNVDIKDCLEHIMAHFEEAGEGGHHHHHEFEEEDEEQAITGFLAAMACALTQLADQLLTQRRHKHGYDLDLIDDDLVAEERAAGALAVIARALNRLGLPDMVLFLLSSAHRSTVMMAAQLGWLMLDATPRVFEAEAALAAEAASSSSSSSSSSGGGGSGGGSSGGAVAATKLSAAAREHKKQEMRQLSQWAFHDALESGPMARRALQAIQRHLQHMQEHLFKREHEDPLDRLHRDQAAENLDVAIVVRLLGFLEALCGGCFTEMQDLLRRQESQQRVDIVACVVDLAQSLEQLFRTKAHRGFDVEEVERLDAIREIHHELQRTANDVMFLQQLFSTLGALVGGPNVSNQRALLEGKVHEPVLLFLRYLNAVDDAGDEGGEETPDSEVFHSMSLYVYEAVAALMAWCDAYGVVDNGHGDWVQQDGYDVDVDTEHMHALTESMELCKVLDVVDECSEAAILFLLLGLLEGRREGDAVLDTLGAALFPEPYLARDVHFKQSSFFRLLDGHSVVGRVAQEADAELRSAALQRVAPSPHTAHFFDHDVAKLYYTVARMLSEQADTHRARVAHLLSAWEAHAARCDLRESVARIEVLRGDVLQPVYFQVPSVVNDTKHTPQVRAIRTEMINNTVLQNPEQKLQAFFGSVDFLMNVMTYEARIGRYLVSRVLAHQRILIPLAFLLAVVINIWVIFGLGDDGFPRGAVMALAAAHAVVSGLIVLGQSLSPLQVDVQRWREASEGLPLLRKVLLFPLHWSLNATYPYYVVYLVMSLLGVFLSLKMFCFHLFDLVLRVEVMGLVLRAVKQNVSKLLGTFLLTFFIIYAFTLVGKEVFGSDYGFADSGAACAEGDPLDACLRDHLYYGFYSSPVFERAQASVGLFVYSLLYFMIVVLVMAAIVSGIIIDSFSEYRAETEAIAAEKESRCFVCNFGHDQLQVAHKGGFEGHVRNDHNVWNYVWFLMRVLEKRAAHKPLTGVEIDVSRQWDEAKDLTSMMPMSRALCLEETKEEASLDNVMDALRQIASTTQRSLQLLLSSGPSAAAQQL